MPPVHYQTKDLPPRNINWAELVPLMSAANAALGKYTGSVARLPDILLAPLAYTEAVASSRIEGTQSTLVDVLEYRASGLTDESTPMQADNLEVLNYHAALNEATRMMGKLPLSERVLKAAHKRLMQGTRGLNKNPGQYRGIPVWIGNKGASIKEASYVPCPVEHLHKAMASWEKYINSEDMDPMVQLAIMHAEFEAIHPFLDGNGRVGRLLIPLFLQTKGLLDSPNFYLAEYLENHRAEYYQGLLAVSENSDWTGWCKFFLQAVINQVRFIFERVEKIHDLYQKRKEWMVEAVKSKYGTRALDWMFHNPIFTITEFVNEAGIPESTARRILIILRKKEFLVVFKEANGRRSTMLAFPELINICEGRKAL